MMKKTNPVEQERELFLDDFNIGEAVCCLASERELMRLALMRKE